MELIVFSGIQGSGKTTFYLERFFTTHLRISLDLVKTREREEILLHACLAARQPMVVDNTHPLAAQRKRLASMGIAAGFKTVLYFFDASTRSAVGRNSTRQGKARVPNVAIFGTQKKLQRPTKEEGFDEIYRVTAPTEPTETIAFVVEPWNS
jgi:predicted kinase